MKSFITTDLTTVGQLLQNVAISVVTKGVRYELLIPSAKIWADITGLYMIVGRLLV